MPKNDVKRSRFSALLGVPLAVKVMGIVLGVVVLFSSGMLWSIHQTWHATMRRELDRRAGALAADLARACAGDGIACDDAMLRRRLADARALDEAVGYVLVQDSAGAVISRTATAPSSPSFLRANGLAPGGVADVTPIDIGGETFHDAAAPIVGAAGAFLRVGISERSVTAQVRWLVRRLAVVTLAIAVISLAAAWFLTRVLAHPVYELVAATRSVREGRLGVSVPVYAKDETGELARAFNEMTASLQDQARERQHLLRKVMGAAEAERKRLARELHDETGQALTSVIAGLGALESRPPTETLGQQLAGIRELAERTLRDVQGVSRALRPIALDDFGLEWALRRQCEALSERFGCTVELQTIGMDGQARLSPEMEIALYRIVQESLTNAVRHGHARTVHVLLHRSESRFLVVVEDDGHGFDSTAWRTASHDGHLGLVGIEERAALFAGIVRVESAPGSGTSVFVELPLAGEA